MHQNAMIAIAAAIGLAASVGARSFGSEEHSPARSGFRPLEPRSQNLSMKHKANILIPDCSPFDVLSQVPIVSPFSHLIGGNHPS